MLISRYLKYGYFIMRKLFIVILFVSFGHLQVLGQAVNRSELSNSGKPNIILIMADDLGMETLKSYGGESYFTPNLDRLAATGMQFQNCYSTPLCTPSRVQIMTGKYSFRNYIGFGLLDSNQKTFGHLLQEAGYQTCVVGKWQLYGNKRQQDLAGGRVGTLPSEAGFDTYRLWQVKDRGWRYKSPTVETHTKGLETFLEGYGPDTFTDFIDTFITENRDRPFFVYYPMCLVHDPFLPTPESEGYEDYHPELNTNDTTYFRDMMTNMDKQVGRIVNKLDELNLRENTVILFVGDNGTDRDVISQWKGQSIRGEKGYTVEAGTHVPFIANWNGTIAQAVRNDNLVDFTDFLPSILDLAGVEDTQKEIRDGMSFYQQLLGKPGKTRDWIFCHYEPRWGKFSNKRYVQNTKLKLYQEGGFFDITKDPGEQLPLDNDQLTDEQIKIRDEFRKVLTRMKND